VNVRAAHASGDNAEMLAKCPVLYAGTTFGTGIAKEAINVIRN
jgi:hypothetical protein